MTVTHTTLIEVALPLERINTAFPRQKFILHWAVRREPDETKRE
jgi:hypothetical protein